MAVGTDCPCPGPIKGTCPDCPYREPDFAYAPRDLAQQTLEGTLPYEETWRENAINVLKLLSEVERLRGERFDTSDIKTRDLGHIAVEGLTVMRDEDDDDSWALPDLRTINRALSAVSALVQHAEDRQRFKRALTRIGKEWRDQTPDAIRSVPAGGSARVPLAAIDSAGHGAPGDPVTASSADLGAGSGATKVPETPSRSARQVGE